MVYFFASWLVNVIALYLLVRFMPFVHINNLIPAGGGIITTNGLITLLIASLVFGALNSLLRPLLNLITLPINILTFGLFSIVTNGFVFWLTTKFVPGFWVNNFWWAIAAGILMGILNWFISHLLGVTKDNDNRRK